jgi:HEPN domain-containing protein
MHVLTAEWVAKAEGDFATAGREVRARNTPNYDAACFHAQQAAEKYLKAVLQEHGSTVPRTHNLITLLELVRLIDPTFATQRPSLMRRHGWMT